jgi:hypothetical protein
VRQADATAEAVVATGPVSAGWLSTVLSASGATCWLCRTISADEPMVASTTSFANGTRNQRWPRGRGPAAGASPVVSLSLINSHALFDAPKMTIVSAEG